MFQLVRVTEYSRKYIETQVRSMYQFIDTLQTCLNLEFDPSSG